MSLKKIKYFQHKDKKTDIFSDVIWDPKGNIFLYIQGVCAEHKNFFLMHLSEETE